MNITQEDFEAIKNLNQSSFCLEFDDATDTWIIVTDAQRRVREDCRHYGRGESIAEAIENRVMRQTRHDHE
jgi:hypothetical protein